MSLISKIKEAQEQRRINKEIETNATPEEKRAIELIDEYSLLILRPMSGCGIPLRTPRPSSGEYSKEVLLMKDFLEKHSQYTGRGAHIIRGYYNIK